MKFPRLTAALFAIAAVFATPALFAARVHAEQLVAANIKPLAPGVFVAGSVVPADIAAFKARGGALVIDLLPDDEASPQARAAEIAAAAQQASVRFVHAPTPSNPLSMAVVEQVGAALAVGDRPALIFCRSGSRATRVWALTEAARAGGMDAAGISSAAASAGYSVADVRSEIERRIAARPAK